MTARPEDVIREDIRGIAAYPVQHADGMVKLDAMENPYGLPDWLRAEIARAIQEAPLNRYPDPDAPRLKARLREVMRIPEGAEILLGNGSDELIAMVINAVAGPHAVIMAPTPAFVMYKMSSIIAKARYVPVPLEADFSLDADRMIAAMQEQRPSAVFLSYPNNPTGNLFSEDAIARIIERSPGLVVIDEAYQHFSSATFMPRLMEFPNLMVMRTLSKLGLAGLRLGYAAARPEWMREIDKVRGPYNVGILPQLVGEKILEHHHVLEEQARSVVAERERMMRELAALPGVRAYPSEANFILARVPDANAVFEGLKMRGVLIRSLHGATPLLEQCVRFTVGTPAENDAALDALRQTLAQTGVQIG
jgi:histidinol-phosphate aminotransferase